MNPNPDWSALKTSTSPPLSLSEVQALPRGMLVLRKAPDLLFWTWRVEKPGHGRAWQPDGNWSCLLPLWIRGVPFPEIRLPKLSRLSFALTDQAIRERRKTVTRRLSLPSWWKEGAWFLGVDKIRQAGAQGLCIAQCGPATYEDLALISQEEVEREGFPDTTPEGFLAVFRSKVPRSWDGWAWRLPFSYLEIPE